MTTSNKSDSLQRPEGRGFSPTLLMKNQLINMATKLIMNRHSTPQCKGFGWNSHPSKKKAIEAMEMLNEANYFLLPLEKVTQDSYRVFHYSQGCVPCSTEAGEILKARKLIRR